MIEGKDFGLTAIEMNLIGDTKDPMLRLGMAVMLKHLRIAGFFPNRTDEAHTALVVSIAEQLEVNPSLWKLYDPSNRTAERHKRTIREFAGFQNATVEARKKVLAWVLPRLSIDDSLEQVKDLINERLFKLKIVRPTSRVIDTLSSSAHVTIEKRFFNTIARALSVDVRAGIDNFLDEKNRVAISELKQDPGRIGLETLKKEASKLNALRELNLPSDVLCDFAWQTLQQFKRRIGSESLHEIRRHPPRVRYALFAIFAHVRTREITDDLCSLLIHIIHRIGRTLSRLLH